MQKKYLSKHLTFFYKNKNHLTNLDRRRFLQPQNGHLQLPTASIILNGERLNAFPLDQEQDKDDHHFYLTLYWRVCRAITQEKESKCAQNQKKELNPFLFTDDLVLYIENPKEYTHTHIHTDKKLLELIREFIKVAGYKIKIQKLTVSLY